MTTRARAESALFATALIWGGTFVITKVGLIEVSPVLMVVIRFSVTSLFFLLLFANRILPIPPSAFFKGMLLGVFLCVGFLTQTTGLVYTSASKSAFITGTMVFFTPLLQLLVGRKPLMRGNMVGVVVALAGMWLLTSPEGAEFNRGDALTLLCAFMYGCYIVYLDRISHEMSTLQLTFLQSATTSVLALGGLVLLETPVLSVTARSIAALAYLTFLATMLTTYLQTRFQKHTTPTRTVIIFALEPVCAALLAYVVLGEEIGPLGIVGGALIVCGLLVSQLSDVIPMLNREVGGQKAQEA